MTVAPARLREIAQAIADKLNLATQPWFPQYVFTAKRSYWTYYKTAQMDPASPAGSLLVDVMLDAQDWQAESRGQEEGDYGFSIVFQQKVDRTNLAAVDTLIDLVEAVADAFTLGKDMPIAWSAATAYVIGAFVVFTDGITYRCILAHTNQVPPNGTYWQAVNPIMVAEKHNPIVYCPVRGDTSNTFQASLALVFRHDK